MPDFSLKWSGGYDAEWQVLNSKDFGVPQNRERCFIIGHLRGRSSAEIFPVEGTDGTDKIQELGHRNGFRRNTQVFDREGITEALSTCQGGGREHHTIEIIGTLDSNRHSQMDVASGAGIHPTLTALKEKPKIGVVIHTEQSGIRHGRNDK